MPRFLLLAVVLLLAGCTDADWAHVMPDIGGDKPLAYPDTAAAANYAAYASGHASAPTPEQKCARVAQERTDDVGSQGFDGDVQREVHDRTYTDCMTWSQRTAK